MHRGRILALFGIGVFFVWIENLLLLPGVQFPYTSAIVALLFFSTPVRLFFATFALALFLDSATTYPFGLYTLAHIGALFPLFRCKTLLLFDTSWHRALAAFLFSFFCTLFFALLLFLFDTPPSPTLQFFLTDLFAMPLLDAVVAWGVLQVVFAKKREPLHA